VQRFAPPGFRNVAGQRENRVYAGRGGDSWPVEVAYATGRGGLLLSVDGIDVDGIDVDGIELGGIEPERVRLTVDGVSAWYDVRVYAEAGSELVVVSDGRWTSSWSALPRFKDLSAAVAAGGLSAPLPGTVTLVGVRAGDSVAAGQTLVVLEAMKMEHRIVAAHDGVVDQVLVAVGDAVDAHAVVVRLVEVAGDE
jgi:propionyl-CoA carboxylase alpha chain